MTYYRPSSIEETLDILKKEGVNLMPVAGCTDVAVGIVEKVVKKKDFVDISGLDFLKEIKKEGEYIIIGSLATHAEVASSSLIQKYAPVLSSACLSVGSPQVRNRGTIGGNISHASPSGDSIPALMTLDAEFLLKNQDGERWVKASQYFKGPGKTVREKFEILVEVRFKSLSEKYFSKFIKLGQRKSLACSKASMAFVAMVEGNNLKDVRVAMGAVAPTVVRAVKTENFLDGKIIDGEIIEKAKEMVKNEVSPIDDLRSTAEYRKSMMGELMEKCLHAAALNK